MKQSIIFFLFGLLIMACSTTDQKSEISKKSDMITNDVHSYSKPNDAIITHLNLNLNINFDAKVISGTAALDINNKTGTNVLLLDSRDLTIKNVSLGDGNKTTFELGPDDELLGQELSIQIKPETKKVVIEYETAPEAAALQWLSPSQTAGGKHPFLFTQSQAVLARTWIPLQDSPGIKFTYDATVKVPQGLMAVMSAENDTVLHEDGIYKFNMPQPVSSYLMALAVGNLEFHSYDNRSGVFAEPQILEKAAWEFEDLPAMIASAEELYGPYEWGRYDILVLPPSFPFGGMENPRITFATPTIIAGDRSLVALVAHELAHSWSGNLVTNATWNDFWLNEGFTVYFENRIMEKIYGKDYADMLTLLGMGELKATIADMGETSTETHLYAHLEGQDPDEGVTDIAYEKGRFFLTAIENAVGREKFDDFLNRYFEKFAFKSMDTKTFIDYLNQELIKGDSALANNIKIDEWVYGPGLPDNCPVIVSNELNRAGDAGTAFLSGTPASKLDTTKYTTHHWLYFLRSMKGKLNADQMTELDKTFNFTNSGNSEIRCEWYLAAIDAGYKVAYPAMEQFLTSVGRRKFLKPIYSSLAKTPEGMKLAHEIYNKARPGYHTVSTQTIDGILDWKS